MHVSVLVGEMKLLIGWIEIERRAPEQRSVHEMRYELIFFFGGHDDADSAKIDEYTTSVREVEQRLANLQERAHGEADNRIAIEAGIPDYWYKYVGLQGQVLGVPGFGASAPANEVYELFGITAENLTRIAKDYLGTSD